MHDDGKVRVWIAGPRGWENLKPIELVVKRLIANYGLGRLVLVSGGAPGVDSLAVTAARNQGAAIFENKAVWEVWHRAAGPIRSALIADVFEPDLLVAFHYFPLTGTNHYGTRDAIKQARKRDIRVKVITVRPGVAMPSSVADDSPMGNRARAVQGEPPKPPKSSRRRKASSQAKTARERP